MLRTAFATTMSSRPNSRVAASIKDWQPARAQTSAGTVTARLPAARNDLGGLLRFVAVAAIVDHHRGARPASSSAHARPIPREAPLTTATWPERSYPHTSPPPADSLRGPASCVIMTSVDSLRAPRLRSHWPTGEPAMRWSIVLASLLQRPAFVCCGARRARPAPRDHRRPRRGPARAAASAALQQRYVQESTGGEVTDRGRCGRGLGHSSRAQRLGRAQVPDLAQSMRMGISSVPSATMRCSLPAQRNGAPSSRWSSSLNATSG